MKCCLTSIHPARQPEPRFQGAHPANTVDWLHARRGSAKLFLIMLPVLCVASISAQPESETRPEATASSVAATLQSSGLPTATATAATIQTPTPATAKEEPTITLDALIVLSGRTDADGTLDRSHGLQSGHRSAFANRFRERRAAKHPLACGRYRGQCKSSRFGKCDDPSSMGNPRR